MEELALSITSYLRTFCEKGLSLDPAQMEGSLPLFLREHYTLWHLEWMGKKYLLALENPGCEVGSPKEYRNQVDQMRAHLGKSVVLVLPEVSASVRNRLVEMRVPFIVPKTQLFLPEIWIDLQEKYPRMSGGRKDKPFTPTAQLMLLYHLQCQNIGTFTGEDLSNLLGFTPAMISKCREEFEQKGLCTLIRVGKSIQMEFSYQGRSLWEKSLPFLVSPVKNHHWIRSILNNQPYLEAGVTALSKRSMLADDPLPTLCLHRRAFNKELKAGKLHIGPDADLAQFRLEEWSYDPGKLSRDGEVDNLSLWLSLRDDPDERVQGEINLLLENVPWS